MAEVDVTRSGDDTLQEEGALPAAPASWEWVSRGTAIGRYLVLRPLGSGGMGMVFLADDPELDRRVAIKLLRPDRAHPGGPDAGRRRLLREAQAIAQLSHPNVISVYDVGAFGDGVFIAMEFVEGADLRAWLAREKPELDGILDVFIAVGRALQAAHAAGIVHRDIKPDNVLIGAHGVRVMDFGLARTMTDVVEGESAPLRTPSGGARYLDQDVTQMGAVMGTPAYMAPEQLRGRAATSATDQFAFCVALYEAVFGRRPFPGGDGRERYRAIRAGNVLARMPHTVPRRLRVAVGTGLRLDPGQRFADMQKLVDELVRVRGRRRRNVRRLLSVAVVVVGAGLGGAQVLLAGGACDDAGSEVERVWGDEQRRAVEAALGGPATAFSERAWEVSRLTLDAFADEWAQMRRELCDATVVRRERSGSDMDRGFRCLDGQLAELEATVATLATADAEVVRNAVATVSALPEPSRCSDPAELAMLPVVPADPDLRARVAALRGRLAGLVANRTAGRFAVAAEEAEAMAAEVAELAYSPLTAEYELERARLHGERQEHELAEQHFRSALRAAELGDHDPVRARVWLALADELGPRQKRFGAAEEALQAADAVIEALGSPPELVDRSLLVQGDLSLVRDDQPAARRVFEALLEGARTTIPRHEVLHKLGRVSPSPELALERLSAALALREETFGRDHPLVAETLHELARRLMELRRFDETEQTLFRALAVREEVFGRDSPAAAETRSRLGVLDIKRERYDEAIRRLEEAVATISRDPGAIDFDVATIMSNLGVVYGRVGRTEEARGMHLRALDMLARSVGPDHPRNSIPLMNVAATYQREDRPREAIPWLQRTVALLCGMPENDARCADLTVELGNAHLALEERDEAERLFLRAMEHYRRASGHDAHLVSGGLVALAQLAERDGEPARALALLEEAIAEADARVPRYGEIPGTYRFRLAQLLWRTGRRERAREVAAQARRDYLDAGEPGAQQVVAIDAWLHEHAGAQGKSKSSVSASRTSAR